MKSPCAWALEYREKGSDEWGIWSISQHVSRRQEVLAARYARKQMPERRWRVSKYVREEPK